MMLLESDLFPLLSSSNWHRYEEKETRALGERLSQLASSLFKADADAVATACAAFEDALAI